MTQSRDKCEQPCCADESRWLGFIAALLVFMAVLIGAGLLVNGAASAIATVVGALLGIGR